MDTQIAHVNDLSSIQLAGLSNSVKKDCGREAEPEACVETPGNDHLGPDPEVPAECTGIGALTKINTSPEFDLPVHPACSCFPLMPEAELAKLAADIKTNGLAHPVVTHEGQVIDGRNRLLACRRAGVEAQFIDWRELYGGSMTLSRWVWSVNAERRHLTADQVATAYAALHMWEAKESARQRQIEAGRRQGQHGQEGGRGNAKPLPAISSEGVSVRPGSCNDPTAPPVSERPRDTRSEMAIEAGVTAHKMQQAMIVVAEDPALAHEVIHANTTLKAAVKQVKAKKASLGIVAPKPSNRKSPKMQNTARAFDMDAAIANVMRDVDPVLEELSEEQQKLFLTTLIDILTRLQ